MKKGLKEIPKNERPREKLTKYGPGKLSDAELLAILLGTGVRGAGVMDVARSILKRFSKEKLGDASVADLSETFGLGEAKSCEIVACLELGRRVLLNKKTHSHLSPKDVWDTMKDIRDSRKEHFVVLYLDTNLQEIQREIVSVGTLNESLVHPREVFEAAVRSVAASVIVSHNHPSGNTQPSNEDIEVTKRLIEAGKILGIEVLDHVIVTKKEWFSLKENGLL